MPSRFAFTCLVLAGDDRFERIAQLVQRQLYAIGIDMTIEPLPLARLRPRLIVRATSTRSSSSSAPAGS